MAGFQAWMSISHCKRSPLEARLSPRSRQSVQGLSPLRVWQRASCVMGDRRRLNPGPPQCSCQQGVALWQAADLSPKVVRYSSTLPIVGRSSTQRGSSTDGAGKEIRANYGAAGLCTSTQTTYCPADSYFKGGRQIPNGQRSRRGP